MLLYLPLRGVRGFLAQENEDSHDMSGWSIGPLIAVCCQATILLLSSDTPVAIAPSELVRLRRRSDRGWRDDCLAGLAIDVGGGFVALS